MDIKAYTLGIFDGEGCITATVGKNGRFGLRVSVQMNAEAPVRLMLETWGGAVHQRRNGAWCWSASSQSGKALLEYVAMHSLVKKRQAELALQLAAEMREYVSGRSRVGIKQCRGEKSLDREKRMALVREMRSLNGARQRYTVT